MHGDMEAGLTIAAMPKFNTYAFGKRRNEVAMEDRRKNRRMELQARLVIKRLDSDVSSEVDIEINDVSKTGVGFTCDETLNIGAVYESFLTIWTKEVLHAFLQVVRIEMQGSTYSYGAVFIGMSEVDKNRIEIYQKINGAE